MMRRIIQASLIAAVAIGLFVKPVEAGLLQAIDTAMNNYAKNIVQQGDNAINDVKNGDPKKLYDGAFKNFAASYHEEGHLGGDALRDTKAIFAELKKIAMWLPNKIKAIWKKIVDAIGRARDRIDAGFGGGGAAASATAPEAGDDDDSSIGDLPSLDDLASEGTVRASAGLGDGFLGKFHAAKSFSAKFQTYTEYRTEFVRAQAWVGSLGNKEQRELAPKMSTLGSEVGAMTELMAVDASGRNFDAFVAQMDSANPKTAKLLYGELVKKVGKKLNMQYLGNKGDTNASRKVQQMSELKTKLGLS